jgi:hypothetical protein
MRNVSAAVRRKDTFVAQQNLVRGVLARRERKIVDPNQTISDTLAFRNGLRRAFLKARWALDVDDYEPYLDWCNDQLTNRFPNYNFLPIGFDFLNGVFEGPAIPLEKELTWTSVLLARESTSLTLFRKLATKLEIAALSGDKDVAFEALSKLTAKFGESMWSVQLRLGLEQGFNGLEAQKSFYELVRPTYKRGILTYVAYHTSVRNEDRTSIARFREDLTTRIEARLSPELQSYLKYRLLSEWSSTAEKVADVLRVELSHSIVDVYETLIALGQETVRRSELSHFKNIVARALSPIEVDDFRLVKLKAALGDPVQLKKLRTRNLDICDSIANGNLRQCAPLLKKEHRKSDAWLMIYGAVLRGYRKIPSTQRPDTLGLTDLLERILRRSTTSEQDIYELEKLCFNLSAFSASRALLDFLSELKTSPSEPPLRFYLSSINCEQVGPEDFGLSVECDEFLRDLFSKDFWRPSVQVWHSRTAGSTTATNGIPDLIALAAAIRELEAGKPIDAIAQIQPFVESNSSETLRNLSAALLIRAQISLGDRAGVIQTIGDEGARNPSRSSLLPIREALQHLEFSDYRALGARLTPLIALDLLWKETDDDRTASMLRFATSQFLRTNSKTAQRPSEFAETATEFALHQLIYFLRYVCVQSVIDVSRVLKSSREVQEERQAICGVLNTLDPINSGEYEAEIFSITHRLKIAEGLRIVDRNRIHVDTDAITRWAKRTIVEEFARYRDLLLANIGLSDNFDDVLKEAISLGKFPKQVFFTPESEADAVLLNLLMRLKEEFLNNSTHGLDYYLSKRVRHQSFVGLVRGPLEFNNIITTKTTEHGDYRPNKYWLDRLTTLTESELAEIDNLFRGFAGEFDQAVRQVKDLLFHVRSLDQPSGIFEFELSAPMLLIARAVAVHDITLDDFLKTAYAIFWGSLDPALSSARFIIANALKMSAANGIDALRLAIRNYAEHDPAFTELSIALGKASAEVQVALSEAETWFNRPEIEQATRRFTLTEALDVAIESAMKLHRTFKPAITRSVVGDIELAATDLVFITDAVFISFSNIKSYCGLSAPPVQIELIADAEKEVLTIEIYNEYAPRSRSAEQDAQLEEIRNLIEQGAAGKRVRKEGGTGFLKLFTVVSQSDRGALEFGYTQDNRFRFFVALSLIVPQTAVGGQT